MRAVVLASVRRSAGRLLFLATFLTVFALPSRTVGSVQSPAVGGSPFLRVVMVGSQGWTPEADSLVPAIAALSAHRFVHLGDVDFSYAKLDSACAKWPGLRYYCDGGTLVATAEEVREGWRAFMAPVFPGTWEIAVGNHEKDGARYGAVQPYYATLFPSLSAQPYWRSADWPLPNGAAHIVFLDTGVRIEPGTAAYAWLEAELAGHASAPWLVIVAHDQPYSVASPPRGMRPLLALLDRYQVDLWIGGHALLWERSKAVVYDAADKNGMRVVASGETVQKGAGRIFISAGGGGMHPLGSFGTRLPGRKPWTEALIGYEPTFAVMEFGTDGLSLTVRALDAAGATRDKVVIHY